MKNNTSHLTLAPPAVFCLGFFKIKIFLFNIFLQLRGNAGL